MTLGEWLAEVEASVVCEGPTAIWDACKLVPGDKRGLPVSKSVNAIREPLPQSFCEHFVAQVCGPWQVSRLLGVSGGGMRRYCLRGASQVLDQTEIQRIKACKVEEKAARDSERPERAEAALQEMMDHTFRRVLTRDRVPDDVREPRGQRPFRDRGRRG